MPERQARGVQATPCKTRTVRTLQGCTGKLKLPQYRAQSVIDAAECVVQLDSVEQFMDELLPYPVSRKRARKIPKRPPVKASNHPFRTLEKADSMREDRVVRLFAAAVKDNGLTPGLGMARCQNKPDKSPKTTRRKDQETAEPPKVDIMRQKVDAAFYRPDRVPKDRRPHWADQIIPVEFKSGKRGNAVDPFTVRADHGDSGQEQATTIIEDDDDDDGEGGDEEPPELEELEEDQYEDESEQDTVGEGDEGEQESNLDNSAGEQQSAAQATETPEPQTTSAKEVLGQIATYIDLLQAVQQRMSVFMLFIVGRRYRILHWDRAGVIVTPSVDYYEEPDGLCEFLWRISYVSDVTLGFDPTATRLSPGDPDWVRMEEYAVALETDVSSEERVLQPGELESLGDGSDASPIIFDYVRTMFAQSIADPRWPRYKLRVSPSETEHHDFLVGKPTFCASGAIGRGTRGYVAVDCTTGGLVWLKDSWRVDYEKVEQEGLILERLNADPKIVDVPTLLCHADVLCQRTITAAWWEAQNPRSSIATSEPAEVHGNIEKRKEVNKARPSSSGGPRGVKRKWEDDSVRPETGADDGFDYRPECPVRHHRHYRLVVKEVGMPLKKFKDVWQLVHMLFDCLDTHEQAATHTGINILHRDISDSNVIIVPKVFHGESQRILNWTGVLTDWEMSKPISAQDLGIARQPHRSGNWQFKSVNLLNHCTGTTIADELESILLILIYYCIRYLRSSIERDRTVATFLDEFYDCFTVADGAIKCGERKATIMATGKLAYFHPDLGSVRITFDAPPLDYLISESLNRFAARYKIIQYNDWAERNSTTVPRPPTPPVVRNGIPVVYVLAKHALKWDKKADESQFPAVPGPQSVSPPFSNNTSPPKPTEQDIALANELKDHTWFTWTVRRCLSMPGWERLQKVKDRVPKNWVSPHSPIPSGLSMKRPGNCASQVQTCA